VVIDKPVGMSSAAAVAAVRRRFDVAKAGHGGTLDPLASGVLPIALGEATKTVSYVMDGTKRYRFTVAWGEQRETDDREGNVIAVNSVRPSADEIRAEIPNFIGTISQVPPTYSAIKISGRRAYAMARNDDPVVLAPRQVYVSQLALKEMPDSDHAVFEVETGKGFYVRALARDLGVALGTVGHVSQLRRLSAGPFDEGHAIPLDNEQRIGHIQDNVDELLPVEAALADIPALTLTTTEARRLQRGQPIPVFPVVSRVDFQPPQDNCIICAMAEGKPVALAQTGGGFIKPVRVLNL
jgi:tRNA pseudouridine55 synthase